MRRLGTLRGRSLALIALWMVALVVPHLWRIPGTRLGLVRPRVTARARPRSAAHADETPVLAHARASTFVAGANREREGAGAAWTFLLPSLELGLVLVVGAPSARTLRTLSRLASEVVVCCTRESDRRRVRRRAVEVGAPNVRVLRPERAYEAAREVDLAVVGGARAATTLGSKEVRQAVTAAQAAFLDLAGREAWALQAGVCAPCALRMIPARGEVHAAVAEGDISALAYLEQHRTRPASRPLQWHGRRSRRGVLAVPGADEARLPVPTYVRTIAGAAGVGLDEHRAALWAPSEYPSRKAVLFLFRGDEPVPELVVKLTRDGAYNSRLENEWRALQWLQDEDLHGLGALPHPAFFGHHGGLALLGASAVAGSPFRERTTAQADCPLARAALEWLLELGAATAHPAAADRDVAAALEDLLGRFEALYALTAVERSRLHRHVDALAQAARPMPIVLQHGDPGTWNLLVTPGGRPAFLDWEAAEHEGMPLWDVFYFVRSFAVTVARAAGVRSSLRGLRAQLLADTPVNRLLVAAVERQCARIALDRELVEPLFVTCWMHRALKEATRLRPARLDRGHYVNLLRISLDEADSPGLRRLFAA